MADQEKPLELSQMIRSLRAELAEAQLEGEGKGVRFTVEDVELELDIAVEEGIEGGIAAKFYVLTSHYKAHKKDAVMQKIKLKLRPGVPADSSEQEEEVLMPLKIRSKKKEKNNTN